MRQLVAERRRRLREREGEVEALAEALEGQEGVRREVACGHLTVGLLVSARWTLALEAADKQVHAQAAVLADSRGAAAGAGRQLAALTWRQRDGEGWREMRINIVRDKQCHLSHQGLTLLYSRSLQLPYMPLYCKCISDCERYNCTVSNMQDWTKNRL